MYDRQKPITVDHNLIWTTRNWKIGVSHTHMEITKFFWLNDYNFYGNSTEISLVAVQGLRGLGLGPDFW